MLKLTENFLQHYKTKKPNFGPIGEITYRRTYSRQTEDGDMEEFWQTIKRVVEGVYSIQEKHCKQFRLPWSATKAQRSAQEMYQRMFEMKFLPPGRGLWAMGTPIVDKIGSAALMNCAYISSKDLKTDFSGPFCFLMDMSMLGVGVGFDTLGAKTVEIKKPQTGNIEVVEDSREGWVALVRRVLDAYGNGATLPSSIDYSKIRPSGTPLKVFGGIASGPQPLIDCVEDIHNILQPLIGEDITSEAIVDLMNVIGKCVVSGNIRRSAELAIGDIDDETFLNLKNKEINEKALYSHRWASNNSVSCKIGADYSRAANLTAENGEPGYVWMENTRQFGRFDDTKHSDPRAMGFNPCGEQPLEDHELCCVSGDTRIHTLSGSPKICDVVDKEVSIWNGKKWSKVTPFIAGQNKELYRVTLSDGSVLDVTSNHKWKVKTARYRNWKQVKTIELQFGQHLPEYEIGNTVGVHEAQAFEYGLMAGDGFIDRNKTMICYSKEKQPLVANLPNTYISTYISKTGMGRARIRLDINLSKELRKIDKIPDTIFRWDKASILQFIAGYIETDGNVCRQVNTDNYRIFGAEGKLRDIQILLRRVHINHSSIYKMASAGETIIINGNKVKRNYDLWVCYIPSYECNRIPTTLKKAIKFGSRFRSNNAYPNSKIRIDAARKQKIISVTKLPGLHTVYCFTEPELHMGVFGNALTYQCLIESFPARHDSYEDYERTLKFAYLYGKTVTLVPTHNERTNAVIMRNRRIGTSQSGVVQNFQKIGKRQHFEWCDKGYKYIRELDEIYSDWLCIPRSIKVTTIKPSGTVSLLPGATPGIHYPHSEYYFRTIRFSSNSPFVLTFKKAGYRVEQDKYSPNTEVVYFPVHEEYFNRSKKDVTIWEQLEITAQMQKWWSDNAVSVTITFKENEKNDIKHALELYETRLKAVAFLPSEDHGYKQAPYQEITREEYEDYISQLSKIKLKNLEHEVTDSFCDKETCQITS